MREQVSMTECVLRDNFMACGVNHAGSLTAGRCRFEDNLYAAVFVGDDAARASVPSVPPLAPCSALRGGPVRPDFHTRLA
mmetsp:Transcript_29712/g.78325  ORF Transcript_29712/g.78325 Transcript_29712/m.78325 type:complete len:80 (+) Transcript_29712:1524-1763(+)